MSASKIELTSVTIPSKIDRLFEKQPFATASFSAAHQGTTLKIEVRVSADLDDADIVPMARHTLHTHLSELADATKTWALTPDWIAERVPEQKPTPTPSFDDSDIPFP